jgi:hypothetical protein
MGFVFSDAATFHNAGRVVNPWGQNLGNVINQGRIGKVSVGRRSGALGGAGEARGVIVIKRLAEGRALEGQLIAAQQGVVSSTDRQAIEDAAGIDFGQWLIEVIVSQRRHERAVALDRVERELSARLCDD